MISHRNQVFLLENQRFSYMLRIGKHGQPEHLHFGAPVKMEDASALCVRSGIGWGSSVQYDGDGTCLDVLALEWSGSGRGDYRESPFSWSREDTAIPSDFIYESYRIVEGAIPMTCGLPQAQEPGASLELTMTHPGGVRLKLIYSLFETAITRRTVIENHSEQAVRLSKIMSYCLDLPGDYELTTFDGGWIAEMRPGKVAVGAAGSVHESTTGFSSNRHQPGFLLSEPDATEEQGRVYGFNLIYSGNHYASCRKSLQGLTRVMQGIGVADLSLELEPGDCFETPEGVMTWSDEGFNGMSANMHDFVNHHIIPKYWQFRERPVLFNNWEGCMFDFNRIRLLDLASRAKKLGCELFVLDDGWFGKRDNDKAGLGDYTVNRKKLPGGLRPLVERVNAMGMEFGLWFEPEAVNPDSDLYRTHPDWTLTDELSPVYGRNELLLDLTKPEVRDYIVESVSSVLDSANITYVKWDMNRHSTALGAKAHAFVLGLYDVLRRIFEPRKHILLESCSSGGNRFDLGMLCFSPQIWCSDDTDPIERLTIQNSLSYLYPQSTFGAHVSAAPHAQTLRTTPLSTRGNVSFFGILGYELDLKHLVGVEEKEIAEQIEFYKQYRTCFQFGRFRRIRVNGGEGWQVSMRSLHLAGVFHRLISAAPGYQQLRLQGLNKSRKYTFVSRKQLLRVGQFGGLVKHILPVDLNPNGAVLRTADRLYPMTDGVQTITATGGALMSGVMLSPRFMGTGYDADARNQGDFSSNIYVIREVNNEKPE